MNPETHDIQQRAAQIAERLWRPHLGTLHTKITAADYEGVRSLVASISIDIAIEAARQS